MASKQRLVGQQPKAKGVVERLEEASSTAFHLVRSVPVPGVQPSLPSNFAGFHCSLQHDFSSLLRIPHDKVCTALSFFVFHLPLQGWHIFWGGGCSFQFLAGGWWRLTRWTGGRRQQWGVCGSDPPLRGPASQLLIACFTFQWLPPHNNALLLLWSAPSAWILCLPPACCWRTAPQ